jgi:hypothetical protein
LNLTVRNNFNFDSRVLQVLRKASRTTLVSPFGNFGFKKDASDSLSNIHFSLFDCFTFRHEFVSRLLFNYWIENDVDSWQKIISVTSLEYFN